MNEMLAFSKLDALSDVELVELAKARGSRDDRPFRTLMERHTKTVWRVCYGFVKNAEDAEDLAQEVFLKAHRNLARFEGRSSFKTWVYRIAINTSQNELRRRSRRPQTSNTTLDTATEFMPSSQNVEETVLKQARYRILSQALKQLKPNEFKVLLLKDIEGISYAEIAEELSISLSAAKMRVQRARIALQSMYRQLANEQEQV